MPMEEHTLNGMSDELKLMFSRFWHEQFVEKLAWRLPAHPHQASCECDQYDTERARYQARTASICASRHTWNTHRHH